MEPAFSLRKGASASKAQSPRVWCMYKTFSQGEFALGQKPQKPKEGTRSLLGIINARDDS